MSKEPEERIEELLSRIEEAVQDEGEIERLKKQLEQEREKRLRAENELADTHSILENKINEEQARLTAAERELKSGIFRSEDEALSVEYLTEFGKNKSMGVRFNPKGICMDGKNLFVIDSDNRRIGVFLELNNGDYRFERLLGEGALKKPARAIIKKGKIYVTDRDDYKIKIFSVYGNLEGEFGGYGSSDGLFIHPACIAASNNLIYVGDPALHRIQSFDYDSGFKFKFGKKGNGFGKFREINDIVLNNNIMYVIDGELCNVQVFNSEGDYIRSFGEERLVKYKAGGIFGIGSSTYGPEGIASSGGRVCVSDTWNHKLHLFETTGEHLITFGHYGEGRGEFMFPKGVAMDRDRIFVADDKRVQVFKING